MPYEGSNKEIPLVWRVFLTEYLPTGKVVKNVLKEFDTQQDAFEYAKQATRLYGSPYVTLSHEIKEHEEE